MCGVLYGIKGIFLGGTYGQGLFRYGLGVSALILCGIVLFILMELLLKGTEVREMLTLLQKRKSSPSQNAGV